MLVISERAGEELNKVLDSDQSKDKHLVLYFMGAGCSGPALGMTLYDTNEGLDKLETDGITAWIDPKLNEYLKGIGDIKVDFVDQEGNAGYTIKVGEGNCGDCKCS